jgi:hypothetical protein
MKFHRGIFFISMIIYYFDFYFYYFKYIKNIILIVLFNTRLVNEFESDKLLNLITDSL